MNLAQRLLKAEALTPEELAPSLHRQKKYRGFLAKHLLDLKLIEPEKLAKFVHSCPPPPRTLVDRARYFSKKPQLTSQDLDYVCQTYFVKPMGITDYDAIGEEPKAMV